VIELRHLAKAYAAVQAVSDVSLIAPDRTITGLLGPNGAGKTTTLRMLSTLVLPDRGQVLVDGIDAHAEPNKARARLGVLPDDRGLYPRLTAREHLEYFGQLQGVTSGVLESRIAELSELLDLKPLLHRRVEGFSQGERTKVAIGRALVHGPANVVLDEATNGLDVVSTQAMRTVIRRLAQAGCAILFSTHVMQEVSALCDRIVVMSRGRVVASGAPIEIQDQTGQSSLEAAFMALIGGDSG
jgi:sodium transport system ATP-binding protein